MGFLDLLKPRPRGYCLEARPEGIAPFAFWGHPPETGARLTQSLERDGVFEPFETLLVQRLLPHFSLFLDLSAGVGWYTAIARRTMQPGSEIHAFEPDRRNFGLLKLNAQAGGDRVTTHLTRMAVSAEPGSARLFQTVSEFGEHSLYATESAHRSITVPATTLDASFRNRSMPPLLARMGMKGGEPWVFRGGASVLGPQQRENAYLMEFWPNGMAGAGDDFEAFASGFSSYAQQPFVIYRETQGLRPATWDELGGRTSTGVASMRRYSLLILAVTPGTSAYFAVSDLITGF
ncbi:MAG: FkbM family methyltransferase [Alphaproteobacteria bacterium]|nr:FkbM family methyltransferase [Alphaproteobacteria bacterium]